MQEHYEDDIRQCAPFRPSGDGIIALLDAPEIDEGVLAEAAFYGAEGIADLLAAVKPDSDLHPERKAAALYLLGKLGSESLPSLASQIFRSGNLGIQVSLVYALADLDRPLAEKQFLPIIEKDDLDISLLREHTARALWAGGDDTIRLAISRAIETSSDIRLRNELLELLVSGDFPASEDNPQ